MAALTSWANEAPTLNHDASFEIADGTLARVALDNAELCGRGLLNSVAAQQD